MNEKQIRDFFRLRLSGVENGTRSFSINCNKEFFDIAKISNIEDGDLNLQVEMTKTDKLVDVHCRFNGYVVAPCDRCLLPVKLTINKEDRLIVKLVPQVEADNNENEDIWIIDENSYELDIYHFVYESIFLAMPIQVLHEDDEDGNSTCDPAVLRKLEELSQIEDTNENTTDPRWDALKNLKLD